MYPPHVIQDVLSRVNIEDVIGETVRLKRLGGRLLGLCPFHGEKTPSFNVHPERGFYHCFGCGASGDAIKFVMQQDGLSFVEALQRLADRAGVELPRPDMTPEAVARDQGRDAYYRATQVAADLYAELLASGRYRAPVEYLEKRGIDADTVRRFGLGFAPEGWSTLLDHAATRRVMPAEMERAGLAIRREGRDGHYDRFRNRVMFPIRNLSRKVLAFSGRTLDPEERAKYINSPETPYYTKGRELFGLDLAQKAIREKGFAILVEGNFDVVSMHARGFANTVAPLGTALTEAQVRLLRRFTEKVVLFFDGDAAGRNAARKALDTLLESDMPGILLAALPEGSDPDDIARSGGAEALQRHLDAARPMLDATIDEIVAPAAGQASPSLKREAIRALVPLFARMRSSLLRDQHVAEVARRLELDPGSLARELRRGAPDEAAPAPQAVVDPAPRGDDEPVPVERLSGLEVSLVAAILGNPDLLGSFHREELRHLLRHPDLGEWLGEVARLWVEEGGPHLADALKELGDGDLRRQLGAVLVLAPDIAAERTQAVYKDTARQLRLAWLRAERSRLSEEIRRLEAEDRLGEAVVLYQRCDELNRLQHALVRA
jgi:DNA primase